MAEGIGACDVRNHEAFRPILRYAGLASGSLMAHSVLSHGLWVSFSTYGTIAPDVARRLIAAGRASEAYDILRASMTREAQTSFQAFNSKMDEVYEDCLNQMGKLDELKAHLWTRFKDSLSARALRDYLKLLPDFDDVEAEETALDVVEAYPRLAATISFLVEWPALERAARVVLARRGELDGDGYTTLTTAAEALDARYPLAATLLRRAMIEDTLNGAKSTRYRHAVRHLAECQASDQAITDFGAVLTHQEFVAALREKHARNYGFWSLVDG
ncbi:DUF6880 family protein [Loktanella sp. SALINAS62]|uniref:DUF6880 family protein n=1 Tax=Loktanella sp. SALINAS62 TaxID=2706124 RepID=UPI001B8B154A|nr:DUF6880 family protein [Loktanella sp. SALINAS62]MBS1301520.1 hypothetical protein [Loktanella sp. SALINAS62]